MKKLFCITLLLFLSFAYSFSQENANPIEESSVEKVNDSDNSSAVQEKKERDSSLDIIYLGEMYIRATLGLSVPLFSSFFNDKTMGVNGFTNNSSLYGVPVGGSAAIEFIYFLENNIGLGGELAGQLLQTKQNYQSLISIGGVFQYMFRVWPFDIPLYISAGLYFNTLYIEDQDRIFFAGPYVKPGFSFFYNINEHWSVGANTNFWIVPELYFDSKKSQSNFTFFWDIGLSARYKI